MSKKPAEPQLLDLTGLPIQPHPTLAGCKLGYKRDGVLYVSPAFYSLLTTTRTAKEMIALMRSYYFLNTDPDQDDTKWLTETAQRLTSQYGLTLEMIKTNG